MVRLGELLAAPTAGALEESVSSKLLLLHRMSLERDARAKVDHELLPPAEVAIAPDAGTVVDAHQRPPIHGELSDAVDPGDTAGPAVDNASNIVGNATGIVEDTTDKTGSGENAQAAAVKRNRAAPSGATPPTADNGAPIANDAAGDIRNTTDTAGAGEHARMAATKLTLAVPATAAADNSSSQMHEVKREAKPVVVKSTILSPDATTDILVIDGEATRAAATRLPVAAGAVAKPTRTAAVGMHSPRRHPDRQTPSEAEAADPADAVVASNAVDVAVSATATEAAADGVAARADSDRRGAVATVARWEPSNATAPTSWSQSDRLAAATTEPVGARKKGNAMGAAAPAVASDAMGREWPLTSPVVTPGAPFTHLNGSGAAATTLEPVSAMMDGLESPLDAAVAAVIASSAVVGATPPALEAPQQQATLASAHPYTQMVSRVAAAAVEAAVMEATATAWATATAGAPTSKVTTTPCSFNRPPGGGERAGSPTVAPLPSGQERIAMSDHPPSTLTALSRPRTMRGGERHRNQSVPRLPPPRPPSAAVAATGVPAAPLVLATGGEPGMPFADPAAAPTYGPATPRSRGVYLFAGDGSVLYTPAGGLAQVGDDMTVRTTAASDKADDEEAIGPTRAARKGAARQGLAGKPEVAAFKFKRMVSKGGVFARGQAETGTQYPPPVARASLGLRQWPAHPLPSPLLSDLPTPVHHLTTAAAPAAGADASPVANRLALPWAVRLGEPAALITDAGPGVSGTEGQRPGPAGPAEATPPPPHTVEGTTPFAPVVRAGGPCHYNQTSCSCARRLADARPPSSLPMCIRYAGRPPAGAPTRCTAEPCERPATWFVCDCMGTAICDVQRTVVDRWRRIGSEGAGEPAVADGEPFRCELQQRLITVVSCVDGCS